jgi:hypothetical protein
MVDVFSAAYSGSLLRRTFELCAARQPSESSPEMLDNCIARIAAAASDRNILYTMADGTCCSIALASAHAEIAPA